MPERCLNDAYGHAWYTKMRTFTCRCGSRIYFENCRCLHCGAALGFLPDRLEVRALSLAGAHWRAAGADYRMCVHYVRDSVCNWMVPADDPLPFCAACRLNEVIPDLGLPENQASWARLEAGKRYLLYGLARLGLSVAGRDRSPQGLAFAFMADEGERQVLTGHADGLITINVREGDDAYREAMRKRMGEGYRTVLGHFRHESGHYYWQRLIAGTEWLPRFRERFGDERADYAAAITRHYELPRADWAAHCISAYAASHPWEDWAETWAHYLLIRDALETAQDYGLHTACGAGEREARHANDVPDHDGIMAAWTQLSGAINGLGQSLGMPSLYPFVFPPRVRDKLRFVHEVIGAAATEC